MYLLVIIHITNQSTLYKVNGVTISPIGFSRLHEILSSSLWQKSWELAPLWIKMFQDLGSFPKTVAISCWHWLLLLKSKIFYGSFSHFQEDSNALKYALFGYCMNKLWIFEVSIIAFPKAWVRQYQNRGPAWSTVDIHFRAATVRFLHCRPTFCLPTEIGKPRF
jgi:hypothetical protein